MNDTRKSRRKKENAILEAALGYATLGFSVIPVHGIVDGRCTCGKASCPSAGKHPALPSWKEFQKRRATEGEIRGWFTGHPELNVGIVTGRISGIVVLDVDGEEGHQALREAVMSKLPATPHVHTGGGGDHYFFRYPENGIANSAGKIAERVDVRGEGGFVVAPPSMHRSGDTYSWVTPPGEIELAEMPLWMAASEKPKATTGARRARGKGARQAPTKNAVGIRMSLRQQEQIVLEAADEVRSAPEGERNDTLNRVAYRLTEYESMGLDPDLVWDQLTKAAKEAGLSDQEVESTFSSAWNAGTEKVDEPAAPFDPDTLETVEEVFRRVPELAAMDRDRFHAIRRILKDRLGEALNLKDLDLEVHRYRKKHAAHLSPSRTAVPYLETDAGMFWRKQTREGPQLTQLTNFSARITADITEDDGAEKRRTYEIEADLGRGPRRLRLLASAFMSMNWPAEHLGAGAIIFPGPNTREHARTAIQLLSGEVPERTEYAHTGWRKLPNGLWVYLQAGGALGALGPLDGIEVHLPDELSRYRLPNEVGDPVKAVQASLNMLNLVPDTIGVALLGAAFRAPCGACDFSVFLSGLTGAGKSELAALVQQHFGPEMDRLHLPGNYASTANSLEATAFQVKDAVLVVDDFAPTGSMNDVLKLNQQADRLLRGQGNRQGRQRMKSDGTLRPSKPPRGLILSTGEDVPRGQSLRARTLVVEVGPKSVDFTKLTQAQKDAREGLYAQCMAGYIKYLAARQPLDHKSEIVKLRDEIARADSHRRTPDIVANVTYGIRHFLDYAQSIDAITEDERRALRERCWSALLELGEAQAAHQAASEPVQRFLELLGTALSSGVAHVATPEGNVPSTSGAWGWRDSNDDYRPQGKRVGWLEQDNLYLDFDAALAAAQEVGRNLGDSLTISPRTLRKRLSEKGLLQSEDPSRQTYAVRRRLDGRERNVIHLHASCLSGDPKPDKPDSADDTKKTLAPSGGSKSSKTKTARPCADLRKK